MPSLLLLLFLAGAPSAGSRLAVIQPAPDFALTTQAGTPLRLADLKGKVVLVSFVFATCNGSCPATTARMCQVQQQLRQHGLGDKVHLLSITLDPARDTPEALRNYMRLYDADPKGWSCLTGTLADVNRVIGEWGMWVKRIANGQLDHPSRVFLVDPRGQVREIYNLDFFKADWVLDDITQLLKENQSKQP